MYNYDGHGDIIYWWEIDARIKALNAINLNTLNDDQLCDHVAELDALVQFRENVISECGGEPAWNDSPGFVADSYFWRYAYDNASEIYGNAVVDAPYWNQDAYEEDQRKHFVDIDLDGVTYLVDKEV